MPKVVKSSNRGSKPGQRRGGRKAGTPNKMTRTAREAFEFAFNDIGGAAALAQWGRANPTPFYQLYGRLIPTEQQVAGAVTLTLEYVDADD